MIHGFLESKHVLILFSESGEFFFRLINAQLKKIIPSLLRGL